jgi:tRNA pseudouridine55 synthase
MKGLVRTKTGHWTRQQCLTLEQVEELQRSGELAARLVPLDEAVDHLPAITLSEQQSVHALQGKQLPLPATEAELLQHQAVIRIYAPERKFIGLCTWDAEVGSLAPHKIFSESFRRSGSIR